MYGQDQCGQSNLHWPLHEGVREDMQVAVAGRWDGAVVPCGKLHHHGEV